MATLRNGSRGAAVKDLQRQLNTALSPSPRLVEDGIFGPGTKRAVVRFQQQMGLAADGIAGPKTFAALKTSKQSGRSSGRQANWQCSWQPGTLSVENREYFPFSTMTGWSWTEGARAFGSKRSSGSRAHAGCDLYYPQGTKIHAVTDGVVVRGPYFFYAQTYAIEINHGSFIARYGEVKQTTQVSAGDTVYAGQHIANVGHLVGISVPSDMLHFEMYSGADSGALTVSANSGKKTSDGIPFNRRSDLLDPTSYLNVWKSNLAPSSQATAAASN